MKKVPLVFIFVSVMAVCSVAQAEQKALNIPFQYALGKSLFEESCSSCHGVRGHGSEKGPPLMHKIYEPSHHGDASFYRAALTGTKAHHWKFGDMPPVAGMSKRKMDKIIPYLRWLQRQNGIQ